MRQTSRYIMVCLLFSASAAVSAQDLWRCPGNVYTNTPTSEQKKTGCVPVKEGGVTVVPAVPPSKDTYPTPARQGDAQQPQSVDREQQQKQLEKARSELSALEVEYKNGQPDRLGPERNYQKYLDRVERLKNEIASKREEIRRLESQAAPSTSDLPS